MGWLNALPAAALPGVSKARKVQVWMCSTQHENPEPGKLERSWDPRSIYTCLCSQLLLLILIHNPPLWGSTLTVKGV